MENIKLGYKEELLNKIKSKEAKIAIVGLGYVGLPLVIEFSKRNFKVIGFDIDPIKVEKLNEGKSYIKHIKPDTIQSVRHNFHATVDFSKLAGTDCILICVPTPLGQHREPDMTFVFETGRTIAKYLRPGQLISLESTTYPGTTDEDLRKILEQSQLKAGIDFFLAFSPEREDPNNENFSTSTIPKVVGGINKDSLEVAKALYDQITLQTVPVSSAKVAEATKLLENIYRAVNIALVNELKMLFDKMGIDIWEVIEAAKTKPFGFQPFYPGPGLGGHCIPIDPFYLTWKAREYDFVTRFIELAGEINTQMPLYVVQKTVDGLNQRGKSVKGASILVLGISYKKDVDDLRESPSLRIIELLRQRGASVDYNDPYTLIMPKTRSYNFEMASVELTAERLKKYDCVIVATDHSVYDPKLIVENSSLVIDTRGFIKRAGITAENVIQS